MANMYDAIVIGARCAGSPTAMLLARKGWRVLLAIARHSRATLHMATSSTAMDRDGWRPAKE
jgi:glycine/D-amino acid oxidase-like deaminating enzyme